MITIDPKSYFVQYHYVPEKVEDAVAVQSKALIDMLDLPKFLKSLKEYFYQLKLKYRGVKQYIKCHIVHDAPISNIAETLKEELDGFDFFLRVQPV